MPVGTETKDDSYTWWDSLPPVEYLASTCPKLYVSSCVRVAEAERGTRMTDEPKVTVDALVCIGAAECVRLAPAVFELNEEDQAQVVDPDAAETEVLRQAADACPSGAIRLRADL